MSSLRGQRSLARNGEDALGDEHYPGTGAAAKGAVMNPALQPGDQANYVYDWANIWPSATNPGGSGAPAPNPVLLPGDVDGPYNSPLGLSYWLSRSGGQGSIWYYWIDTDSQPGPDTKRNLVEFLADDAIDQAYRDDVRQRAMDLGYGA